MRKFILFLFVFFLLIYSKSNAQIKAGLQTGFGISNTAIISETKWDTYYDFPYKNVWNYKVGLYCEFPILDWLHTGTGLLFQNNGFKNTFYVDTVDTIDGEIVINDNITSDNDFSYLSLPLYLKYDFSKNTGIQLQYILNLQLKQNHQYSTFHSGLMLAYYIKFLKNFTASLELQSDITPYFINHDKKYFNYQGMISLSYQIFGK